MVISWRLLPSALREEVDIGEGPVPRSWRDVVVDIAALIIAAGLDTLSALDDLGGPDGLLLIAIGAVGCLVLLGRRRWPIAVALVLVIASAFLSVVAGAAFVATFSVAVHRRRAVVLWIGALGILTGLVNALLYPDPDLSLPIAAALAGLLTAVAVGWGTLVRARRQLLVSLAERARLAEADQRIRFAEIRRAERTRLAREMHDVLAHRMSLISVHAGALEFRPDASTEEIGRAAGVIRAGVHQMLLDLREVIGLLREDPDSDVAAPPQPALSDVLGLAEESRGAGVAVELDIEVSDIDNVPSVIGRTAYRIVQEGLTNARKHAPGEHITILLRGGAGAGLSVQVSQPLSGKGAAIPGAGAGLIGLSERAVLAGGRLDHGPTDGGTYLLRAWLPWEV